MDMDMDMDTPKKNQIGTPVSKFEVSLCDSPFMLFLKVFPKLGLCYFFLFFIFLILAMAFLKLLHS